MEKGSFRSSGDGVRYTPPDLGAHPQIDAILGQSSSLDPTPDEVRMLEESRAALARRDAARASAAAAQGEGVDPGATPGWGGPPGSGGSLAATEAAALADAKAKLGIGQISGQSPTQAAAAAQAALAAGQPRVVGVTKGGFQPSTRSSQAQVERTQMPPGYLDVAAGELQQDELAGRGNIEHALLAAAQARKNAMVRGKMEEIQRFSQEKAAADEDAALHGARQRIDSAMAKFAAAGPKEITYADIWKDQGTGGKITLALGFIAGTLGSMGGGPNKFLEQLDSSIQRKIDIQQAESERSEKEVGQAQSAYDVVRESLRDSEATRQTLNLMYLRQFDQYVTEQAAGLGMSTGNTRLAALKSAILSKQRSIMKELSSKILEQQATADKYAAPQAIVAGGFGAGGGKGGEEATKYELERMKAGLPAKASAINQLKQAASELTPDDATYFENLARRKAAVDPGSWYEFFLRNKNSPATQKMVGAVNTIVQSQGGKALTPIEAARYAGALIGDGSPAAIAAGAARAQEDLNKEEETLHSAFPTGYQIGNLRRGVYRNTDQPHELEGQEKAPDYNKRVISP